MDTIATLTTIFTSGAGVYFIGKLLWCQFKYGEKITKYNILYAAGLTFGAGVTFALALMLAYVLIGIGFLVFVFMMIFKCKWGRLPAGLDLPHYGRRHY